MTTDLLDTAPGFETPESQTSVVACGDEFGACGGQGEGGY